MDLSSSNNNMFENSTNKVNSLQKNMKIISLENLTLSNIHSKFISSSSEMLMIQEIRNALKNYKIIYPDTDEIPLIKIKDEYFFESGERIDNYIYNLIKFDDNKFNKCSI